MKVSQIKNDMKDTHMKDTPEKKTMNNTHINYKP